MLNLNLLELIGKALCYYKETVSKSILYNVPLLLRLKVVIFALLSVNAIIIGAKYTSLTLGYENLDKKKKKKSSFV